MPINWNDKEVLERLFIATLASFDNEVSTTTHCNSLPQTILTRRFRQIDIKEVARLHGGDMTYHALENRLRKWKKEAAALKDEAEGREGAAKSPVKTRARKGAASPAKGAVKAGRITKKKALAATKIKSEPPIEEDVLNGIDEEAMDDDEAVGEVGEFI
ncbi:uncharacterized protein ALTATR162_LOCUS10459 [Alternaria atra]|uniref:Uncharacterized protein n=1 Tax=Alternaria atra TaxID=119953 RepID=A0A8J2I9N9_9PLEO|nr:uncharacterized protein ALTATR162_LOCUS10459 [Alternaria atra]CAG5183193.1 unnamed protein product [Alternaria atra]